MGLVLAFLSCLKWFYLRLRVMDWDVRNGVSERGSFPGLLHQIWWVNINKGCGASTSKTQPSQELHYLFSSHSWTNNIFISLQIIIKIKIFSHSQKTRVLISLLSDTISPGDHAHLAALTQHYPRLALTGFTGQCMKQLNSLLSLFTAHSSSESRTALDLLIYF